MSDNHSARNNEIDVDVVTSDDPDESIVAERTPRAPSITRLGRYRLVREIASGGMASVNLAVTEGLDKLVALKIIHPHLAQEESFVRMFLDEARLSSAISHRNVCSVFDFGESDGRFYIAMDYLSGQSLRDVLRKMRKTDLQMEPRRVAVYIAYLLAEACEGLHAAHELHNSEGKPLNVVHRDVSPHNLFVTYDGNLSVVDFGIARASDRIQSTATGVLKGKFSYMAPEQMRQLEIDRRADIWALGVVLWESLTLQRLFVRSSQADTVMSVMMDRVRPPSEVRPDIPRELDAIVLKAIARNPAQRYATAREMGRELMKFCRESGVMVSPIEIEHFMEKLFEKEIADSKALMRKAKQSSSESGVWMDVTPSGFGRVRSSGSVEKGAWTSNPPGAPVDVVGEGTQSAAKRMQLHGGQLPGGSLSAPAIGARSTAHPDLTQAPSGRKQRPMFWVGGVIGACALVLGTVFAMRMREPQATHIEVPASEPRLASRAPQESVPATGAQAAPEQAVKPSAAARVEEPSAAPPAEPASPQEEEEEAPQGTRGAQPQRRAQHAPSRASARASSRSSRNEPDARAEREEEEPPAVEKMAPAPREEPAPPPVAPVAPEPAPAPVERPAAAARAEPVAPAAPQKLDADANIAELAVEGSLGSSIVSRMLSRAIPALKSCYTAAARKANRNDFGALASSLRIDEVGAVRDVVVAKSALPELSSCAASALKRMRAERVPDVGTVRVNFRITYSP